MKSFFSRHDRLFSVIGAGIVFATFVVKDNLGERWKGSAEGIEHAQADFSTRHRLDKLLKGQDAISNSIYRIGSLITHDDLRDRGQEQGDADPPPGYSDFINIPAVEDLVESSETDLDEVEGLLETINDPDLTKRWHFLHDQLEAVHKGLDAEWDKVQVTTNKSENGVRPIKKDLSTQISEALGEMRFEHKPSDKLAEQILSKAKTLYDANKKKAAIAGWVNNAFFVLGWCLGIIGTLAKQASKNEEPDQPNGEVAF